MLRAIRACASLLVLEDEHSQGWRPVFCAGLPGGFHSGGLSFSDTAPLLFSLHPPLTSGSCGEQGIPHAGAETPRLHSDEASLQMHHNLLL